MKKVFEAVLGTIYIMGPPAVSTVDPDNNTTIVTVVRFAQMRWWNPLSWIYLLICGFRGFFTAMWDAAMFKITPVKKQLRLTGKTRYKDVAEIKEAAQAAIEKKGKH